MNLHNKYKKPRQYERLKKVLSGGGEYSDDIQEMLTHDINSTLGAYFDLQEQGKVEVKTGDDGIIEVSIKVNALRLKNMKII